MSAIKRLSDRCRHEIPIWITAALEQLENRLEDAVTDNMVAARDIRLEADRKKDRRLLGIAERLERGAARSPEFYQRPRKDAAIDKHVATWLMTLVPRMVSKTDQQILRHSANRLLAGPGKASPERETATRVMMREREEREGQFGTSVCETMREDNEKLSALYHEALESVRVGPGPIINMAEYRNEGEIKFPGFLQQDGRLVVEAVVINGTTVPVSVNEVSATNLGRLIAEHVDAALGHVESLVESGASLAEALSSARRQAEGGEV